ncbi:formyltransferase family protein [Oceanospirillum linum]|uniref:Methionyl-tRNA formyltransferase n=1 Tax=Oceanospirillum linum TaxID=966 RepID=A0A1T1HFF1_OCELI|nr:formyltransferase family protein [Oceanospirillum linum]OOV88584.1 methionyl-tRNA formyltransferase [Oceanospirillum linum]SEF61713.1 methionyl-tRNA formyltransferase [Oleiphilus messinensis]SMP07288.1 methionyl-tRNA formyltransferase [Oceanospirillum linum]
MKIAILTSPGQWFEHYAQVLSEKLNNAPVYLDHKEIGSPFDVVFILSYHKIIDSNYLEKHKHNIVIHESDLPKGKGWAPLFWQVLEGNKEIVFTMFEAADGVDKGDVYMKKTLQLTGSELNKELRKKQAELTLQMCQEFINEYDTFKQPTPQTGSESFYPKRTAQDSKLDVNKTIKEQFNLLRIVDNNSYPAFFELDDCRYRLTIELDNNKEEGS